MLQLEREIERRDQFPLLIVQRQYTPHSHVHCILNFMSGAQNDRPGRKGPKQLYGAAASFRGDIPIASEIVENVSGPMDCLLGCLWFVVSLLHQ
jgi:hypothetical protein